jgi:hypothetical protein
MSQSSNRSLSPGPQASKIAERFIAHAKLCQQIASQCRDEEIAHQLERLAEQCVRAASNAIHAPQRH